MKARSVFATVASVALATTMIVGLTACKTSAKSIKGEKVEEDVWTAALDMTKYESYKVDVTVEGVEKMSEDITITGTETYTCKVEGKKQYIKTTTKYKFKGDVPDEVKEECKDETIEYYVNVLDEGWEAYVKGDDSKWTKATGDAVYRYAPVEWLIMGAVKSDKYADYEYKDEDKGYVLKNDKEGSKHVVKITDKKVKAIYVEKKGDEGEQTLDIVFTHSDQKVELPSVE